MQLWQVQSSYQLCQLLFQLLTLCQSVLEQVAEPQFAPAVQVSNCMAAQPS